MTSQQTKQRKQLSPAERDEQVLSCLNIVFGGEVADGGRYGLTNLTARIASACRRLDPNITTTSTVVRNTLARLDLAELGVEA